MFKFLKSLFSSGRTIERSIDLIDKSFYTDQEKAGTDIKKIELKSQILAQRLSLSSLTRRYLAWAIMMTFLFLYVVSFFILIFNKELGVSLFEYISKSLLGELAMMVAFMYFGSHSINSVIGKKNESKK